jgi:hypothetical protein
MLSLLPSDSPHLGPILDMLRDPEQLWSEFGIRSLSKSHPEFGQGENYWRGPIWVQMNYMVLGALHNTYVREEGPFQERAREIYEELRMNVVDNVFEVGSFEGSFQLMLMWRRNTKEPGMYGSSTMHLPERAGGGSCPVGDFFSPVLMIHAVVTHSLVGHHLSRSVSISLLHLL